MDQTLGTRRWASRQWIACVLEFKGRRRKLMQPNRYTELFFLDEGYRIGGRTPPMFRMPPQDARHFAEVVGGARLRHGVCAARVGNGFDAAIRARWYRPGEEYPPG